MQTISMYLDSLTPEQLGSMIYGYAERANDRLADAYNEYSSEEFAKLEEDMLTPGGYRVDNLSNSFVSGQDIQMQVTHVETQQVVMDYTMRQGRWIEQEQTDPDVQPDADYSGDTVTVHHLDKSFKVELASAFMDIHQKAGLVATTYLEASDAVVVDLPNGLFFQRDYRAELAYEMQDDDPDLPSEVWRDLVFSRHDVSSEGNYYAVAQIFPNGTGMGLAMSERTKQSILQEFDQQVEFYQKEHMVYTHPGLPELDSILGLGDIASSLGEGQEQDDSVFLGLPELDSILGLGDAVSSPILPSQPLQRDENLEAVSSVSVEQQPEVPSSPQADGMDSTTQALSSKPRPTLKENKPMAPTQAPVQDPTQSQQSQQPQQARPKTAQFKYFELGGARVAGPAANLIAASMKDKGVELKQFQNGGSYVNLKANQVAQAMAIAGRNEYEVQKVPHKEWAAQMAAKQTGQTQEVAQPAQEAPTQPTQEAAPLTQDADLSTVIKGNVFAAAALQQSPDSKVPTLVSMREKDVVTVGKDGGIRIDKGAKDGKGVMVMGQSKEGNFYAAHKGLADVEGKLQAVDPTQNKQPALLYKEDAVGNVLTNRVAEANQVLPKALDFSNVATAIRGNMPQLKADITAEAKAPKSKAGAAR